MYNIKNYTLKSCLKYEKILFKYIFENKFFF